MHRLSSIRNTQSNQDLPEIAAVDLFCGAGGLTRGLLDAGIRVVAGYDTDPACQYPYEYNNSRAIFHQKDIRELSTKDLIAQFPNRAYRLLVGCAPCQPFSRYTNRGHAAADSKWALLQEFVRLIQGTNPELVSMENVTAVQRHPVFHSFVNSLEQLGYQVSVHVAYAPEYGVPQQRERRVLLASRLGPITLLRPTQLNRVHTVRTAIGHLPSLRAGQASDEDWLHRACSLSDINLRRIRASKPGGCWRDWPAHLIAACHRAPTGKTYPSVYGRMKWDEPSPTITTQFFGFGNGRFGHPEQDRALTPREGALLQSFPLNYQFNPPNQFVSYATLGRLIGNAVPVRLAKAIGKSVLSHVDKHSRKHR